MTPERELRCGFLFDYAVDHPEGFVIDDLMAYGWSHGQTNQAIRDLRELLGKDDSINLPCDPAGHRERWVYRLVGDLDSVRGWITNRVADAESRVRTMRSMMASIVAASDGRTIPGKKARAMELAFRHLIENLDQITADGN